MITRKKTVACPHCGYVTNAVSGLTDDRTPEPGDVSICIECGNPSIFTEDGSRTPSATELLEIMRMPECANAINNIKNRKKF